MNEKTLTIEKQFTTSEVAEILQVSARHIQKLVASGRFPKPVHVGASVRFNPADVRDFLKSSQSSEMQGLRDLAKLRKVIGATGSFCGRQGRQHGKREQRFQGLANSLQ